MSDDENAPRADAEPQILCQHEQDMWGPPPLLPGEDPLIYEAFRSRIRNAVKPRDFIEEMYTREILYQSWVARGLRLHRAAYLKNRAYASMSRAVLDASPEEKRERLKRSFKRDSAFTRTSIERLFLKTGKMSEAELADMLGRNLDAVEQFDRAIERAETRRDAIFREVTRHRATLGADLRRAIEQVEEADFEVVAPPTAMSGSE